MITDCFDDKTEPVISLRDFYGEQKHLVETCLILFSQKIYQHLLDTFPSEKIGLIGACNGNIPIYRMNYKGKDIAFYLSGIGSAIAASECYEASWIVGASKFVMFGSCGMLLCKQAAKNFHTICKKETALKRVLSNLLSAVSLLRFKAVFSCGFRVPPGSGLYQSCAAGSVCIPAGQKYCSPRPRKSCPADRKTLGLPSRCIGHRW